MEKCNNYQFLANNMTDENMAKCLSAGFAFEVAQNNKPVPTLGDVIDIINSKSKEELRIYLKQANAINERGIVLWQ